MRLILEPKPSRKVEVKNYISKSQEALAGFLSSGSLTEYSSGSSVPK